MASLIECPHCGVRPKEEFTIRGQVPPRRPSTPGDPTSREWMDHVYLRDNPRGLIGEHWYHGAGCGRWLKVVRHNVSHAVLSVEDVQTALLERAR